MQSLALFFGVASTLPPKTPVNLTTNFNRSLQHSMANFYREFPQLRCTELQLKMRLAALHLQLKRVAHEQNTRLAVSSRAQRGSVADKRDREKKIFTFYFIISKMLHFLNYFQKIRPNKENREFSLHFVPGIVRLVFQRFLGELFSRFLEFQPK